MTKPPKMRGTERREQILEVALRLFASRGYHLTKTRDLAREAGVSEPVLYKHFEGKKDLYLRLLEKLRAQLLAGLDKAERSFEKPEDILRAFGMDYYRVVIESRDTGKVIFQTFTELNIPEILEFSRALQLELHRRVRRVIETGAAHGDFGGVTDLDLAAWRFMSIGLTISMTSALGLQERLGPDKIVAWGDTFLETLKGLTNDQRGDFR